MENQNLQSNTILPEINPEGISQNKKRKRFVIVLTVVLVLLATSFAIYANSIKKKELAREEKEKIMREITSEDKPINSLQREQMMNQIFNNNQ